jgi:hypothetical protein
MKSFKLILIGIILSVRLFSQTVVVGPMIHLNFGKGNKHFSWGIEASYYLHNKPISADLGFEFERETEKFRLYSEAQFGFLIGASAGYVREFYKDRPSNGGFQGSIWGAAFLGADMRFRRIGGESFYIPGMFLKIPVLVKDIYI